ncbi:hypothetical protein SteCoe_25840 [Stentor coeruleus]|uniref:Protein kinase domain-containing protein n=1 Tax=Stentor coeruleus TaxID=5963 RepID=A0A1R2BED5_9CILI|nr:hypothetical protein SteCoe_25840 [Stentor coeruleus]
MTEICSLEDLLNIKLIPDAKKHRNSLSSELRKIYDKGFSADISELADCYNSLTDFVSPEFKALIISFYLLKIFELPKLPEDWHNPILFFIKTLGEGEFIKTDHILNRLITKSIYTATEKAVEFNQIMSEYMLMATILKDFDYDTTAEIGYLTTLVKGRILRLVKNYDDILTCLNYLKQALDYGMLFDTTKTLIASMILEWAKDNKNTEKCRNVFKEMRNLGFDKGIMKEIREQCLIELDENPKLQDNQVIQQVKPAKKSDKHTVKNPIYMSPPGQPVNVFVYECSKQGINGKIAVKECKSLDKNLLNSYYKEAEYLEKLSGRTENFLKFYGKSINEIIENGSKYYVLKMKMEYVEDSLFTDKQKRISNKIPYSETEVFNIFCQLINSFTYLSASNINHRDIKPQNILITKDKIIKIIDFNVACEYIDQTYLSNVAGTKDFMSPEMRKGLEKNPSQKVFVKQDKSDVFSLGMTLLYLLSTENLCDLNLESRKQSLIAIVNKVQFDWARVILNKMLEFDINNRYSLKKILAFIPNIKDGVTISN